MAYSHAHMFRHMSYRMKSRFDIKRLQFTGRDMPLQKSSEVAILVSLQECGVFLHIPMHRETNSGWATGQN